jgi:hypothetical protein
MKKLLVVLLLVMGSFVFSQQMDFLTGNLGGFDRYWIRPVSSGSLIFHFIPSIEDGTGIYIYRRVSSSQELFHREIGTFILEENRLLFFPAEIQKIDLSTGIAVEEIGGRVWGIDVRFSIEEGRNIMIWGENTVFSATDLEWAEH